MMAGSAPSTSIGTESFSAQDRFLIEKTEEALRDGVQLERWRRARERDLDLFPLDLKKKFCLPNRAEGFFDSVAINGQTRSVMGCRQEVKMGRLTGADAPQRLRNFVLGEFLTLAHWSHEDGTPGGFTVEQSLYKTPEGRYGKFPPESGKGCVDWRDLGRQFTWVLLTIQVHDFVMDFGPFRKRFREAACVAAHSDFIRIVENPSSDYALEVSIGYPFVEFAPIPNVFGFGPGKFGTAVKLYSFFLTPENDVHARLCFTAAPRCQKVFDFGKRWPDPVYGGAQVLYNLSLRRWHPEPFHDRLDSQMLAQHCRVHQELMDGVDRVWSDWDKNYVSGTESNR